MGSKLCTITVGRRCNVYILAPPVFSCCSKKISSISGHTYKKLNDRKKTGEEQKYYTHIKTKTNKQTSSPHKEKTTNNITLTTFQLDLEKWFHEKDLNLHYSSKNDS